MIEDQKEHFQREANQGVLKRDLYQANFALGEIEACDVLLRTLKLRAPTVRIAPPLPQLELSETRRHQHRRLTPVRRTNVRTA